MFPGLFPFCIFVGFCLISWCCAVMSVQIPSCFAVAELNPLWTYGTRFQVGRSTARFAYGSVWRTPWLSKTISKVSWHAFVLCFVRLTYENNLRFFYATTLSFFVWLFPLWFQSIHFPALFDLLSIDFNGGCADSDGLSKLKRSSYFLNRSGVTRNRIHICLTS